MPRRPRRTTQPARVASSRPDARRAALIAAGLVLVVFLAYGPALRAGFIWDDDQYVTGNETLRSSDGLRRIWFDVGATPQYYPLVFTTFWIEHHLWGADPFPYHLVNVLLHAASAILVWRIVNRLSVPGAAAAAFVFALHPVHVESVAWITERKNVLSGFFYLAAMGSFLRASPPEDRDRRSPSWGWYCLALLLFAAALASKTVTATLPIALLLVAWWKTGRIGLRKALLVGPMIAAGAGAGWLTAWVEAHHVGTKFLDWNLSILERTLIAGRALWFYLGKLLLPVRLTFIYPRWHIDAGAVVSYLAPLLALAGIGVLWSMRARWGRGPLVAALFFVGTLFPALGFIDVYPMRFSYVADHFQYLASLGPIVLVTALAARSLSLAWFAAPVTAVAALLAFLTYQQTFLYRDRETLWRDTIAKNPRASIARINLATELQKQGRWAEAQENYLRALDDPDCLDRADVWRNLALNASAHGDRSGAIAFLEKAVTERPGFARALVNLGELYRVAGRMPEAVAAFERAVAADPNDPVARIDLGSARIDTDRLDDAVEQLRAAIALQPDAPEAHYNLGNALARLKRPAEAEGAYLSAIRIRPGYSDAHLNLANLWLHAGRFEDALGHLETALRADPESALVHYNLAYALDRLGRRDEAATHYREAALRRPDLKPPPGFVSP